MTCYACQPETAKAEFILSKRIYEDTTGRTQDKNVLLYQIRQSFKPGEVTPEQAHKIAYELAMSFTKGKHAFVVATHTDKAHIHTHIDFNSTSLDCAKKFRDFKRSGKALAKISDRLCLENGLSIIENPKRSKGHYGKWLGDKKPLSHSDKLRQTIDTVLAQKPKTFDEFLRLMQAAGYEIKYGKHYEFKSAEQKKFIRLCSLGEGYSEDEIKSVIDGKAPQRGVKKTAAKQPKQQEKSVNLLVDIQEKLRQGKGKGYYYVCSKARTARGKSCDYKAMLKKTDIEPLVIEAIRELIKNQDFATEIKSKIGKQIDTSTLDRELKNYESKLREVELNKTRLENEIDSLPEDTRFRERKLHDMTLRLDGLYDIIVELEEKIEDVKLRRKAVEQDAITLENIYTLLFNFDKVYDKISDEEKKSLISSLIKEIEIFPCDESELPLKSILFNFPVYKDGGDVYEFLWDKSTHVSTFLECVILISKRRKRALA